jgi:transcriptional regulator with XRE-family HTH domain
MFQTLNDDLSEYLKLLRFKSKKSQEDVAKELDISRNTYTTWENNPMALSIDTLNKITNVFGEDIIIFFKQYVAKSNNKE